MSALVIALAGNPNCGKTTLYNALTGSSQRVGNFPGVTVERTQGLLRGTAALVVDLPGTYSLAPFSAEEAIAGEFLEREHPDAIIDVVDATNIERNLYLTTQLLETGIPLVVALNMMDAARAELIEIDIEGLSAALGVRVLPVSASAGEGIDELVKAALEAAKKGKAPRPLPLGLAVETALARLEGAITTSSKPAGVSPRRLAARLLEEGADAAGDAPAYGERVGRIISELEAASGTDCCAAIAAARYEAIDRICAAHVKRGGGGKRKRASERIDAVLTNRYLALPILALALAGVFYATFGAPGRALCALAERAVAALSLGADTLLARADVSPLARSLVRDGALAGVGGVLAFLPSILLLFLLLSLLEDCGYMARVAYIMDRPLRAAGLTGRSIVPLLAGFGCSVPAVLATRTLPTERDRKLTALIVPFMSCSAKLPVYTLVASALARRAQTAAVACLYALGALVGLGYCAFFKKALAEQVAPFVIELPDYRLPTARSVLRSLARRAGDFVKKAFRVIFLSSLCIWLLQRFTPDFRYTGDAAASALAALGRLVSPALEPLGLGDWRIATALVAGLSAKEAVAGALAVLFAGGGTPLADALGAALSAPAACALLVFSLLYMPCVAAASALRRELASSASAALAMLCQTAIAWLAALAVYRACALLGL